jgi:hypothetical protein
MTALLTRHGACRLCGGAEMDLVLSLAPTPPANGFVGEGDRGQPQPMLPLDLFRCRSCGHVQLLDVVDPLQLFQHRRSAIGALPALSRYYRAFGESLVARFPHGHGRLAVGIGSNDGTLLKVLEAAGIRPYGIEPAVDLARAAIASGVATFPGFFTPAIAARIEEESGRAAIVVAVTVLAHADNPRSMLEGVVQLLARDGVLAFEVPCLADIIEHDLIDGIRHEILNYYTTAPLVRLFHSCDLEWFAAERIGERGGRLRGYVQHLGGPYASDGSVARLVEREKELRLHDTGTFAAFGGRIADLRERLASQLGAWRREGLRLAGFGAPAKATTLVHQLALGSQSLDFVVDDSEWKHGLYTPGLHLPIRSPEALYRLRPDRVIVLSWDFAETIIARYAAYREGGGRFLVPLPELRVV